MLRIIAAATALLVAPALAGHADPTKAAALPRGGAPFTLTIENLTLANIQRAVDTQKPKSKAEFLALLPPPCRKFYMLAYASRATPCSSYEEPMIEIGCRSDTDESSHQNLVIIIPGERPPEVPPEECQKVEILETNPRTGEVKSGEVEFAVDKKKDGAFHRDPERCTNCHGEPLRYLADRYPHWPGFFDSTRNNLRIGSPEEQGYQRYKAARGGDDLYKQLELYGETRIERSGQPALQVHVDGGNFTSHYFNGIERTFVETIHRRLENDPRYDKFKFALAAVVQGCPDLETYFPEALRRAGTSLGDWSTQVRRRVERSDGRALRRVAATNWSVEFMQENGSLRPIGDTQYREAAGLSFVLERMGLPPRLFSMSPHGDDLAFTDSFSFDGAAYSKLGKDCATLKTESLAALAGVAAHAPRPRTGGSLASALRRCVDCHKPVLAPRLGAPVIHFESPAALARDLAADASLAGQIRARIGATGERRMPPHVDLTPAELRALRDAIP